jgi:hypothetical protein
MKVLFLDFDGVINPHSHRADSAMFSKAACKNLNLLLKKVPELKIVVSSSWRIHGLSAVKDILKSNGIDVKRVIDITGDEKGIRGNQIKAWLDRHKKVSNFAILDDDSDMGELAPRLVKTNGFVGLTESEVNKVVELLDRYDKMN